MPTPRCDTRILLTAHERALQGEVDGLKVSLARTQRASKQFEAKAAADPLTALANRRTFHERLEAEVERALRYGRALSVACVDVDGFKDVNDTFGHQVGDTALIEVAVRLLAAARESDLVARLGGDEFAVLLPETTAAEAEVVARRAHELIRSDSTGDGPNITVSMGICDLEHAVTAAELLHHADSSLYWAKNHGNDAIWRYSPEGVLDLSDKQRAAQLSRNQALIGLRELARIVDAKGRFSVLHSERVASLVSRLASELGWPPDRIMALHETALIHDIGKLALSDAVLLKPGRLTRREYGLLQSHTTVGAQMAGAVLSAEQTSWIRSHHERFDGGGYPDGLSGQDIPEGSRLLALADSWDAMTSQRPYATTMRPTDALQECRRCAGGQFFPELVDVLTAPAFERTLRVFANEQSARDGNERLLEDALDPVFELRCECGAEDCAGTVTVPAREYRSIRTYTRRFIVRNGHELPTDEQTLTTTALYTVVEKP
jgi:diguanylate cyclase (GGDEF)-like protein